MRSEGGGAPEGGGGAGAADVCTTPPRSASRPATKPPALAAGGGGGGDDGDGDDPDSPGTAWQKAPWSPWRNSNRHPPTRRSPRKRSNLSLPAAATGAEGGVWEESGVSADASFNYSRHAESSAAAPATAGEACVGMTILGSLLGGAAGAP